MTAPRFAWERQDDTLQPSPLECQWCGRDIKQGPHKPTCRVVLEVNELVIPQHLRRPLIAVWDCGRCGVRRGDPHRGNCNGKREPDDAV